MDQLGNTERITKEAGNDAGSAGGSRVGDGARSGGEARLGDLPADACTLAVFRAGVSADGLTGTLALQNLESFDERTAGEALGRVGHLIAWAQAQQARLMHRMETIFREGFIVASGPGTAGRRVELDPGLAFSLAAAECATILNIPQMTSQRLLDEAARLCTTHTATLTGLVEGRFSYPHAQVVLDQCENIPPARLPDFETGLLAAAAGQTRAQFAVRARRLRERTHPETVTKRHLSAFEKRRVTLDREEDGMSCLSAHLRAAEAQQIYTALSTTARGEQSQGDSRTADQLRADVLAQLLMGGLSHGAGRSPSAAGAGARQPVTDAATGARRPAANTPDVPSTITFGDIADDPATNTGDEPAVPRAEIMVLINAETLFGADDQPAELHGYGPISGEEARRLARTALGWTGLARNPETGEILGVGRRRKVPAGLRRWLRARDGTCRFPGCRVSTASSDIDHTEDWANEGPTDHGNLAHLCRRHHRFKTLGYWKARQPAPGVLEWTSPTGRVYRTEPFLNQAGDLGQAGESGQGPGGTGHDQAIARAGDGSSGPLVVEDAPF